MKGQPAIPSCLSTTKGLLVALPATMDLSEDAMINKPAPFVVSKNLGIMSRSGHHIIPPENDSLDIIQSRKPPAVIVIHQILASFCIIWTLQIFRSSDHNAVKTIGALTA
jgi:hypothetical protein